MARKSMSNENANRTGSNSPKQTSSQVLDPKAVRDINNLRETLYQFLDRHLKSIQQVEGESETASAKKKQGIEVIRNHRNQINNAVNIRVINNQVKDLLKTLKSIYNSIPPQRKALYDTFKSIHNELSDYARHCQQQYDMDQIAPVIKQNNVASFIYYAQRIMNQYALYSAFDADKAIDSTSIQELLKVMEFTLEECARQGQIDCLRQLPTLWAYNQQRITQQLQINKSSTSAQKTFSQLLWQQYSNIFHSMLNQAVAHNKPQFIKEAVLLKNNPILINPDKLDLTPDTWLTSTLDKQSSQKAKAIESLVHKKSIQELRHNYNHNRHNHSLKNCNTLIKHLESLKNQIDQYKTPLPKSTTMFYEKIKSIIDHLTQNKLNKASPLSIQPQNTENLNALSQKLSQIVNGYSQHIAKQQTRHNKEKQDALRTLKLMSNSIQSAQSEEHLYQAIYENLDELKTTQKNLHSHEIMPRGGRLNQQLSTICQNIDQLTNQAYLQYAAQNNRPTLFQQEACKMLDSNITACYLSGNYHYTIIQALQPINHALKLCAQHNSTDCLQTLQTIYQDTGKKLNKKLGNGKFSFKLRHIYSDFDSSLGQIINEAVATAIYLGKTDSAEKLVAHPRFQPFSPYSELYGKGNINEINPNYLMANQPTYNKIIQANNTSAKQCLDELASKDLIQKSDYKLANCPHDLIKCQVYIQQFASAKQFTAQHQQLTSALFQKSPKNNRLQPQEDNPKTHSPNQQSPNLKKPY